MSSFNHVNIRSPELQWNSRTNDSVHCFSSFVPHPLDTIHVMNALRLSLFLSGGALPLPCITVNTKIKMGKPGLGTRLVMMHTTTTKSIMDSRHGRYPDANFIKIHLVFLWQLLWVEGNQSQTTPTILEVIDQLMGEEEKGKGRRDVKVMFCLFVLLPSLIPRLLPWRKKTGESLEELITCPVTYYAWFW